MPTRDHAPLGAPCWADLWTSDIEGTRRFYDRLFGWEAQEGSPEFGGYFMFHRDGVPVAGCMGDMGDMAADDAWKVYLASADAQATTDATTAAGGQVRAPVGPVADLGKQAVLADPAGATVGVWEEGTFPGFTVLDEPGAPSWFEIHTRRFAPTVAYYRDVFGLGTQVIGDSDEFRYTTLLGPDGSQVAGIMDASSWPEQGSVGTWTIYWEVEDIQASAATVERLGGTVVDPPQDTPYGWMATVTDPAGAEFRLRTGPA